MIPLKKAAICGLMLVGAAVGSYGQIQTAGTLVVNIDPSGLALGPAAWVTNSGSVGGVFQATGLAAVDQPVIVSVCGGANGIMFDGHNFMEHVTAPGGAKLNLSSTPLAGANIPCSIECWVMNPTTWGNDGETMVYWGVRGTGGYHMAFCYSGNGDHGATDHWGYNMGWTPFPPIAQWHHLVYTFDGTTQKIYADGVLNKTGTAVYNPVAGQPITLACQRNSDGTLVGNGGVRGSLALGKVRIHSGALTADQVANNYNFEKASFPMSTTPLVSKPIHRYTFNSAVTNDAVGLTVPDVGAPGGADGLVQGVYGSASVSFTGSKIRLGGGSSATAPYIDLPNRLISILSANTGGSGKLTIEGWVVVTGSRTWPRLFDIGSTTAGEITGPGGSGNGANYFMLAQPNTYRDWGHVEVNVGGVGNTREFGFANDNSGGYGLTHYAVTWDEASGEIIVYENGVEATRYTTTFKFNQIDDVNVWLGRSNWLADNNLQGDYDEFRVYDRVLSPAEVQNDYQGGADAVLVVPGPLQVLHLQPARATMMAGTFQQVTVVGDYQNVPGVNVTTKTGISYTSGDTNVLTVSASGVVTAVGGGSTTVTVTLDGISDNKSISVTPVSAPLAHRYGFLADASDSIGGTAWDGTINGGAFVDGSGHLVLDGSSGYVQLPAGIITNHDAITIETWATFNTPLSTWCELYGFGDQNGTGAGRYYIMMTPHSGGSDARISIADADPGNNHELIAARPGVLDGQANVHIAAVYHPYAGYEALYLNGVLAAINTNITIPLSAVADVYNFIGRSIYNGDPYLNASLDEFRIYYGPLSAQQIAVDAAAGPDQLLSDPGALTAVHLNVPTNQIVLNVTEQATVTGDFANVAGVNLLAYGKPVLASGDTNIVTITAGGLVKGVGPGTTTITATYGGKSDSKTITVQILPPVLTHRYSFSDDPASGIIADAVGGVNWAGTLPNGGTLANGQLTLDATLNQYVSLPSGMIAGYYALTMEAWVSFGVNNWWCRLYDFGDQTSSGNGNTSVFFTPHGGPNGTEATIFNPTANDNVGITGFLDGATNQHIVVVYNPFAGQLSYYLNGRLMGQKTDATILLSTINDVNCWLGRSLFNADAGLNATLNEFRIYNGALMAAQVAVNDAAGPNTVVNAPGALQNVRFVINTNMLVDQVQQAQLLGDFANISGVNLFFYDAPTLSSGNTNVLTVTPDGQIKAVGIGQTTLTAMFNGTYYTASITVVAAPLALKHRYSFSEAVGSLTAADSAGGANADLLGNATFDGAGQMVLDGTNSYAALPSGLISVLSNCTFEVWVTPTSAGNWQRILDFGIDDGAGGGSSYVFISARGAPGMRFTAKTAGNPESPILNAPTPLFIGEESHIVATYNMSAGVATLYQDGAVVASGPITYPLSTIQDINNWLGRSQYSADAYFAGTYNELRIYEGSLTAAEVAADYAAGPNALPQPALQATTAGGSVRLSWPGWATRFSLQASPTLGAGATWSPVSATPANDGSAVTVTLPATGQARFFRLAK